jgi:hypothetical protein
MKPRNIVVPKSTATEASTIRILKRASAPSLSAKSKLLYEVGLTDKNELQLRVVANSGGGTWNGEWHTLKAVQAALDKAPKGEPITADVLTPLFRGTSQNSAFFFLAVLKHAGYVVPSESKKRCYDRADPKAFLEEIHALIDGKPATDAKTKKSKAKPEVTAEKPSASSKKKKAKS